MGGHVKWPLMNWKVTTRNGLIWLKTGTIGRLAQNSNVASVSTKDGMQLLGSQKRFCFRSYCNYPRNLTAPALSLALSSNWI
jgi:hypothetical protein